MTNPDVTVTRHGSLFLFAAETERGYDWLNDNLPSDSPTYGGAFVVEHRYARDIADGMLADGLAVR